MSIYLFFFLFYLTHCMFVTGYISLGSSIDQPADMMKHQGNTVNISCTHTYSSFYYLYWYQQTTQEESFKLLGYLYLKKFNPEKDYDRFHIYGNSQTHGTLQISTVTSEDSAMYFCALRISVNNLNPAYFGNGTKLTVLERDVKEPEVEILKPSGIETRCKKTITLVCVAEKFYPDHVSITWTLGDKEIKENVATDPYATQDKTTKLFSMTSRLKVSKKEFKPKNKYRCTVNFYNGTHDISDNTDEINGIEGISLDIN
uniref:Ig-like domain-containing protein n=1 Tax=Cyprinus carpio TaxID=7962 RepID=A0A8C1P908_CYPCA